MKKHSTRTLELFCAENRSKKHQILEKGDDFESRPSCKGFSPCKGYSLCKMVSLGEKLKIPKTCEKAFHKNIRVVLCKKPLEKNTKYSKNETIMKIGHLAKAIAHAKALRFGKWSVWIKNWKCQKKAIYRSFRVVLCKKPLEKNPTIQKMRQEKTPNIRKMRKFWKLALSPWKGYSRCKMISLAQNIKKPLYKKTRIVLCKKPLAKTPNIREKRQF